MVTGQLSDPLGGGGTPTLGFPVQPFFQFIASPFQSQQIGVAPPAHGVVPQAATFMPPPQQPYHPSSLEQPVSGRKPFQAKGYRNLSQQHIPRKATARNSQGRQGRPALAPTDNGAGLGGRKNNKQMWKARRKQRQKEFQPPRLQDLQRSHRVRTRKFFASSKGRSGMPDAPRNTTSFIMGSSKPGEQSTFPSPATPGLFQQPVASPSPLVGQSGGDDMSELHVNPYGSMNGVIRIRTPAAARSDGSIGAVEKDAEASGESEATTSSDSGADGDADGAAAHGDRQGEHRVMQSKLLFAVDQPGHAGQTGDLFLRARIEEQETQIALLEEENLDLKEKLYLAQMELKDIKRGQEEGSGDAEVDLHSDDEASCAADYAGEAEDSFAAESNATPLQPFDS